MAGSGVPQLEVDGSGLRIGIVASQWHEDFMDGLIAGAQLALQETNVSDSTIVRVPGSFELPIVVNALIDRFDAMVALGVIIKGGTPHFQYVANTVSDQLARIAVDSGKPVGFGILTCDNKAQARDRSGLSGAHESKGHEAALAAILTAVTLRELAAN